MKNVLLVINIVLLLLVGYLYYLQFGNKQPVKAATVSSIPSGAESEDAKVA